MLKLLRINNIALVESVEIELGAGLTLLTGETGAGKSILIDALGLVLGERASTELIRTGEDVGTVEADILSGADELGARPLPQDEAEGIDQDRLAGPRFAREKGETRAELDLHGLDQSDIIDSKEFKHLRRPGRPEDSIRPFPL